MSEGTVRFGTSGVIFTVGMDKKAFIPKLAVGKSPKRKNKGRNRHDVPVVSDRISGFVQ